MKKTNDLTVKTEYTEAGYYLFNRVHYRFSMRHKKWGFILLFILSLPLILIYTSESIFHNSTFAVLFGLIDIIIVVEVFTNWIPDLQVKRTLKHHPEIMNITNTYRFYQDHLNIKNKIETMDIPYENIYRTVETPNYFYIYLNKMSAFLLTKENLSEEVVTKIRTYLQAYPSKKKYKFFKYKKK